MQIIKVAISNYRNLNGIEISFHPNINFLIGENELGKSNLLDLFETLFNRRQFSNEDFSTLTHSIRIDFSLLLSEAEKGVFDDYFDPDNNNIINVYAVQEYSGLDEDINFFWNEGEDQNTPIEIPSSLFKRVNYIMYNSLKMPQDELTFHRGRGGGKFLSYLIDEFVDSDTQFNIDAAITPAIDQIQLIFDKLKPLKRQGLGLYTDNENPIDFASRALKLNGIDGFDIQKSGYGIQFSTLLLLSILERLVRLKQNKRFKQFEEEREYFTEEEYEVFREMYFSTETVEPILEPVTRTEGPKYYIDIQNLSDDDKSNLGGTLLNHIKFRKRISMVLGLDEPEIHLHPYMQRSLTKYICGLLQNQDTEFLFLLKKYFDIDMLDGQVLIVSHSPTVLFDQYEHVIRFCKNDGIKVVSGTNLNLDPNIEKQLLLNFPYIKEAFFSRCVILVEGETEVGAIPLWAEKIIGDLDDLGITVLHVGGISSIPPVATLLDNFKIPNVSIIDKDDGNDTKTKYTSVDGLRTTIFRDFEEELFETISSQDEEVLFDFLQPYDNSDQEMFATSDRLSKMASIYAIDQTWDRTKPKYTFEEVKNSNDMNLLKALFMSWMTGRRTGKSIMLGRALGQFIDVEFIPATYIQLFEDAKAKV